LLWWRLSLGRCRASSPSSCSRPSPC